MRFPRWRPRQSDELEEEVRSHLAMAQRDRIERGESAEEAAHAARREFGNVDLVREVTRDAWGWSWLEQFFQDLRFGARQLRRTPGFAVVAIATIAIGLGANTTVFSWLHSVVLNPLPGAAEPGRVMALETLAPSGEPFLNSYLDYTDFRNHLQQIESITVEQPLAVAMGTDQNAERVWAELVSGSFFDVLQVKPALGRFFDGEERGDAQNAHPVAVISHALWKSRYHESPAVLGTTLRLNKTLYTIIGVAPEGFQGSFAGLSFELWVPATMFGQLTATGDWMLRDRKTRMFRVLTRLKPGVTPEQANEELKALAARMAVADADTNAGLSAVLLPVWKNHYGTQSILLTPLSILMGAAGVVLLIVCANVANLLLARTTSRRKEFSLRMALGAPRFRLVRQLLTETLLLAAAGSVLGLVLTAWMSGALRWLMPATSSIPPMTAAPMDARVFAFSAALALVVAGLAGIFPALQTMGKDLYETLKEGARTGTPGERSSRLRGLLVTSEVALAVVALIGAGLFVKSFKAAQAIHPGFDPDHVVVAQFNLSTAGYDRAQRDAFCQLLRERLEKEPGVTAVSYADYVPLGFSNDSWEDLQVQGYVPGPSENMKIYRDLVAPGYFDLMKIPLLEGRDFNMRDDAASPPVMIVSQAFVRRFLPGGNSIGRKVHGWGRWFTIVGVVGDVKVHSVVEATQPYFYVPIRQIYRPEMGLTIHVRTRGAEDAALAGIAREARAIDPALPVFNAMPLTRFIAASLFGQQIAANLLSVLGGVALLLAAVGLYGVMAYTVVQRTSEIGIRMALGAQSSNVISLVLLQAMGFTATGICAGAFLSAALAPVVRARLVGMSAIDPSTYALAAAFTLAVALISTAVPAWRAQRVDPMVILRHE